MFGSIYYISLCLRGRERHSASGGGAERGRQNLKQAPGSKLSAQSPNWSKFKMNAPLEMSSHISWARGQRFLRLCPGGETPGTSFLHIDAILKLYISSFQRETWQGGDLESKVFS